MQNGSFRDGVELYRKYGKNPHLIRQFQHYAGNPYVPDYFREKLKNELSSLVPADTPPPVPDEKPAPPEPVSESSQDETDDSSADSSEVSKLKNRAKYLHKRHSSYHEKLKAADTAEDRYEYVREIMEVILPDLKDIYDDIRHYRKHGKIPQRPDNNQIKAIVQKTKKLHSAETMASRYRRKVEKADTLKQQRRYQDKLKAKENEISELKEQLLIDE